MKKSNLLIGILVVIALCVGVWWYVVLYFGFQMSRVVEISGFDSITGQELSHGMGYFVDDITVITSAHVVPDDRMLYKTHLGEREVSLTVKSRLMGRDIALLSPVGAESQKTIQDIISTSDVSVGDTVSVPVSRSGSIVRLSARVGDASAEVLAYDTRGEVKAFSGIILPDTPFLPGDSGAPIFTTWGKLIDVVHVE